MTKNSIANNIAELKSFDGNRSYKYRRNYRYYNATRNCSLENIRNPMIVGYYNDASREFGEENDTSANPQLNVIASCIDTLHSKIAQSKVRPFFTTINGTFKDIQAVKQAQQFFDVFYDTQNVNRKISDAFRDACIFDTGVIYVDEDNRRVERVLPFQVYVRPAEANYGRITRIFYEQRDYPVTLLPKKVADKVTNKSIQYMDYGIYYDTVEQTKAYTGNGKILLVEEYKQDIIPFVFLYYKNPILGNISTSVADMLVNIQQEINILMAKIKDASQLNPALTFLVPEGSNLKATQLNNRIGNILTYNPIQGSGTPVTSSTPAFIDSQYITLLNELIQKSYDLVGISMLSAQSKKPTGLNSGIALATMEDVESDRFETQLNQVIRAYIDVAKTCIQVFPQDENILPEISTRVSIKWKDIVKESSNMNIQYSGADNLSKDPSTKLQQLQQLSQAGVIPSARIPQLMQIPDLEMGYSLSNNAIDAVMAVIKDCLENDNMKVPEYIPFELLKEEIINTQLALTTNYGKNKEDIKKLGKLYETVEEMAQEWVDTSNDDTNSILEQKANTVKTDTANAQVQAPQQVPDLTPQERTKDYAAWLDDNDYDRV